MTNLEIPDDLAPEARKAAEILIAVAREELGHDPSAGCRSFYSAAEWRARGEEYGRQSLLVVVHDGGDLAPMLNYDYMCYPLIEELERKLRAVGLYAENCTCWYSAIYAVGPA